MRHVVEFTGFVTATGSDQLPWVHADALDAEGPMDETVFAESMLTPADYASYRQKPKRGRWRITVEFEPEDEERGS